MGLIKTKFTYTKFAKKQISKVNRARPAFLRSVGFSARGALRESVSRKKGLSAPGELPRDHGSYRRSAVFNVDYSAETIIAGFSDRRKNRKPARGNRKTVLSNNIASDTLEFGGKILWGYRGGRGKKSYHYIKPRPHVSVAREKLKSGSGSAGRNFQNKINDYARVYIR